MSGTAREKSPPRPSDHRERLWDRAGEIVADPFQILYQKNTRFVATAFIWNFLAY
jgi:hypothetical protein